MNDLPRFLPETPSSVLVRDRWDVAWSARAFPATLLGLMDAREERLARNETLFRSVNENIEDAAISGQPDEHVFEFFCECSNIDCTLLLPMTIAEYERVRADPRQFVVAPGHELPEIEIAVAHGSAYQVVVKEGEAAEFVTEHNPRSQ